MEGALKIMRALVIIFTVIKLVIFCFRIFNMYGYDFRQNEEVYQPSLNPHPCRRVIFPLLYMINHIFDYVTDILFLVIANVPF